ncbi:MAG: FkbM family methyltransferase [Candidatus Bathyarchaeia archaeon]
MELLIDYSQYGQPLIFRRFIPPEVARWVVDVGAYDGVDGSNSRQLVLDGWNAILIEPLPSAFRRLRKNCAGLSAIRTVNVACGAKSGRSTIHFNENNEQESSMRPELAHGTPLEVNVSTLNEILEAEDCPREFGVLCDDAEGMDLEVLRGLDLNRFRPAVICTEDSYDPTRGERHEYLESNGYVLQGEIGSDLIWTSRGLVGNRSWPISFGYFAESPPRELKDGKFRGKGIVYVNNFAKFFGGFIVQGWAMAEGGLVPKIVLLEILEDNRHLFVQCARYPRSDVATRLGVDLFSGFRASLPFQDVHPLEVYLTQIEGKRIYRRPIGLPQLGNASMKTSEIIEEID